MKTDYFRLWFLYKSNLRISTAGIIWINNFKPRKTTIFPHFWLDKGFKGTGVNRALKSLNPSFPLSHSFLFILKQDFLILRKYWFLFVQPLFLNLNCVGEEEGSWLSFIRIYLCTTLPLDLFKGSCAGVETEYAVRKPYFLLFLIFSHFDCGLSKLILYLLL